MSEAAPLDRALVFPMGPSVRSARTRQGLTQADLARALGVTQSLVSKMERGRMRPSSRVAARCTELLDIQLDPEVLLPAQVAEDVPAYGAGRPATRQLGFEFGTEPDFERSKDLPAPLPVEALVNAGPPPVFMWDIPQTIPELSYLTHNYFRYYGKFPSTLARRLLIDYRPPDGSWVLDNYSGSGTTLVEARCEGLHSIGIDVSPLGALAGRVKTRIHDTDAVRAAADEVERVLAKAENRDLTPQSEMAPRLRKWFSDEASRDLIRLKAAILSLPPSDVREFLVLAYFAIVRRVSRAYDGEVRPHINPDKRPRDVVQAYQSKVADMVDRAELFKRYADPRAEAISVVGNNQRLGQIIDWGRHPIGLAISHPPYLNCFDYAPVYSLEYMWATGFAEVGAGFDYTALRRSETRCWPASDPEIFASYFEALGNSYRAVAALLAPGARCCVVLGDCTIKGVVVPVLDRFTELMKPLGFELEKTILRSTHYGTGKYAYEHRADYHGEGTEKRDGVLIFRRA